jgi:hypothetical protein
VGGEEIRSAGLYQAAWPGARRMPIISCVVWNLNQAVIHGTSFSTTPDVNSAQIQWTFTV